MRKHFSRLFLVILVLGYVFVSTGEGFLHRHYAGEDEQNCSYCHWDHTGAVGTWTPVALETAVFIRLILSPFVQTTVALDPNISRSARGPPSFSA